jgi:DNA polymerase III epsilon subunit-like protein
VSLTVLEDERHGEAYVSVDVEADGPIPGQYSMLSFGAALAGRWITADFQPADPAGQTFYRELKPISAEFEPEALAVSGLDRGELQRSGAEPAQAMTDFKDWVYQVCAGNRPVLVAYPLSFDWMFLYWYLIKYTGSSPFSHSSCLDVKTMYAVKAHSPLSSVSKDRLPHELRPEHRHTHHALDDAVEQAELFANIMAWPGRPLRSKDS